MEEARLSAGIEPALAEQIKYLQVAAEFRHLTGRFSNYGVARRGVSGGCSHCVKGPREVVRSPAAPSGPPNPGAAEGQILGGASRRQGDHPRVANAGSQNSPYDSVDPWNHSAHPEPMRMLNPIAGPHEPDQSLALTP